MTPWLDIYDEDGEMTPTIDIENEEVDDDDRELESEYEKMMTNSDEEVIIDQPLSSEVGEQIPHSFGEFIPFHEYH
ncbi:22341_t:CDS:2 [Rhizophagus irregularis]|nr:22341_t:CDS:2 [Rhizophagus irregularis]